MNRKSRFEWKGRGDGGEREWVGGRPLSVSHLRNNRKHSDQKEESINRYTEYISTFKSITRSTQIRFHNHIDLPILIIHANCIYNPEHEKVFGKERFEFFSTLVKPLRNGITGFRALLPLIRHLCSI